MLAIYRKEGEYHGAHTSQIARGVDHNKGTVHRELKKMKELRILKSKKRKRKRYWRLNLEYDKLLEEIYKSME